MFNAPRLAVTNVGPGSPVAFSLCSGYGCQSDGFASRRLVLPLTKAGGAVRLFIHKTK